MNSEGGRAGLLTRRKVEGKPRVEPRLRSGASALESVLVIVALLLGWLILAPPAHSAGRAECRSLPSKILGRNVAYCALLPPSYDAEKSRRYPVLYFLHGLGENEQVLVNSGGWNLIQDLWEEKRIGEFLIVTPAAGRSFYINSRDGRVRYEDFFIREFLPFIESRYRVQAGRTHRGISGVSMGGYGSLRFGFRYAQLFGSVSAHSAALVAKLPRAQLGAQGEQELSFALGGAFGTPFDPAFWDRNSPFMLVRNGPRPVSTKIYFDCGTEDEFGFNKGAQAFHDLLVSRGIPLDFHLYPGGHDEAYVAQHLPASLAFHSRAFGLTTPAK
jgi:S-formylglutathione hydrolase FrmB